MIELRHRRLAMPHMTLITLTEPSDEPSLEFARPDVHGYGTYWKVPPPFRPNADYLIVLPDGTPRFVWSIARRIADDEIIASLFPDLLDKPGFEPLWVNLTEVE